MEDPAFIHQYEINSFGYSLDDLDFHSFSGESYPSNPNLNPKSTYNFHASVIENPQTDLGRLAKQLKTNSWNSCATDHIPSKAASSSSSHLISFENSNSPPAISQQFYGLETAPWNQRVSQLLIEIRISQLWFLRVPLGCKIVHQNMDRSPRR